MAVRAGHHYESYPMSDTRRKHLSKADSAKRGGQPKTRSAAARAAWERNGAGTHGLKSNKQRRRADKINLKKEYA
jgi:hypothetical protein